MTLPLQEIIEAANLARAGAHPALRLGDILNALKGADDDLNVRFDFEYMTPTGLSSYRGYYSDLAIEFGGVGYGPAACADQQGWMKCGTFKELLEGAIDKAFEGWKGGQYYMGIDTPVWVANAGNTGGTAIIKVEVSEFDITLHTAKID